MADAVLFDAVAEALQKQTRFDSLQARGTLRLALKDAGLEAKRTTPAQMRVVLERLLPSELRSRGVKDFDTVCASLLTVVDAAAAGDAGGSADAPEDLFRRTRERVG
jgi:hypothetical protein